MAGARKAITTDKAAPPGAHYSQGIVAGDHVYVSDQELRRVRGGQGRDDLPHRLSSVPFPGSGLD